MSDEMFGEAPQIALPGNRWNLLDGVKPEPVPLVSVIIAHYRQQGELDRTLAALARQTYPAERLQIIVVDDGSPEPPQVPQNITLLVQSDDGFRLSAARNLGAHAATGDVLCFLDADTSPEPEYVERLTRLPALAPDVVTVGRRRHADFEGCAADEPVQRAGTAHELPSPEWLAEGYSANGDLLRADESSYRFIIGAVVCCSRAMFEVVGGFDESFTRYGGEDWQWADRAWAHGAIFAHVADAVAWHDGADWSARPADRAAAIESKNRETLKLARTVAVEDARPNALRIGAPRVVARIHAADSIGALVVCVNELLLAVPGISVVLPPPEHHVLSGGGGNSSGGGAGGAGAAELDAVFADDPRVCSAEGALAIIRDARLILEVPAPIRLTKEALQSALEAMVIDDLGSCALTDEFGTQRTQLVSQRAIRRESRWGRALFERATMPAPGIRVIDTEPDLQAYFGGWGN